MFGYDPATDTGRFNPDVHYRFFLSSQDNRACVVTMQDFDYRDYDEDRFIGPWVFTNEKEAEVALEAFLIDAAKVLGVFPDFLRASR